MRFLARCLLLLVVPVVARTQAAPSGAIVIGRTDSIWSPTLKENRKYIVYTPASYAPSSYQARAYPVLYLLDGDAHFHSVTGLVQFFSTGINGTYVLPEMIVVAIPNTNRTRDLTPTAGSIGPNGQPSPVSNGAGGGKNFLNFLKNELVPHIDATMRTEPYRVLVGHSLGGITAIDALYTMPEEFNAYVAIDPSLWWDDRLLLKQAKDYFSKPAPAGRTLFVGHANTLVEGDTNPNIHFKSIGEFNRVVESGNKSGIRYGYKYYGGDDHGSVPLITEYDALRFIFDGYKLDIRKAAARPALIAEHFAKVSSKFGYTVIPPERLVNQLASLDTSKTITLLQLNAQNYPKSAHAYQMLGNALLARKDTTNARAAFARSLELGPENAQVKDALAKLSSGK